MKVELNNNLKKVLKNSLEFCNRGAYKINIKLNKDSSYISVHINNNKICKSIKVENRHIDFLNIASCFNNIEYTEIIKMIISELKTGKGLRHISKESMKSYDPTKIAKVKIEKNKLNPEQLRDRRKSKEAINRHLKILEKQREMLAMYGLRSK